MILPYMNVTVIPFLLEALVPDKNDAKWYFGPEYIFYLNKTTKLFMDAIVVSERVTATIKCRPSVEISQTVENVLCCGAYKIILSNFSTQQTYEHIRESEIDNRNVSLDSTQNLPDRLFVLTFGAEGVHVKVKGGDLEQHDVVPDIVDQFNIGIDLNIATENSIKNYDDKISGRHEIGSFTQTNKDVMTAFKCNTSSTITYTSSDFSHKNEERPNHKNETEVTFYLKSLPISYTNSTSKTLTIKRIITTCTYQPESFTLQNEKWNIFNMTQYYNVIKVRSRKFRINTYLEGYVFKPKTDHKYFFSEDLRFKLQRMKPAQDEFRSSEYV